MPGAVCFGAFFLPNLSESGSLALMYLELAGACNAALRLARADINLVAMRLYYLPSLALGAGFLATLRALARADLFCEAV